MNNVTSLFYASEMEFQSVYSVTSADPAGQAEEIGVTEPTFSTPVGMVSALISCVMSFHVDQG
jgi:hypothetical protein